MQKIELKIGNKIIGEKHPVFIIAEAGANFRISDNPELNFKHALKLIDIAAESKSDAVKFQLYRAENLYVDNAGHADYLGNKKSINKIIREMELPYEWLPKLKEYCDNKGIIFLCTPFDETAVDELEKVNICAYKVASYTIDNIPLLNYIASKGKPIILSTGASDLEDIKKSIETIRKEGNDQITLMQCTAKYPAPLSTIDLRIIPELIREFDVPVGLSDHSREPYIAPLGAVALGARIIEKHFTTDNNLPGPDHRFAILDTELIDLVKNIRMMETCLGDYRKEVKPDEQELYHFCRGKIYAIREIKKGELFSKDNIAILRPGKAEKGLDPVFFDKIINKKALKDINENQPVGFFDFNEIRLSPVKKEDKDILLRWRNNPTTRKYSINPNEVSEEEHNDWFESLFKSDKKRLFIAIDIDNNPVGQVRFDMSEDKTAEVSITISPEMRGMGLGCIILKSGCTLAFEEFNLKKILAKIKKENLASLKIFNKMGFKKMSEKDNLIEMVLKKG